MTTQTREWTEGTPEQVADELGGTFLWVSDEYIGHGTPFRDGDTVEAMLNDYASTYHARNVGDTIRVRWELFECGEEIDRGRHTFEAVRA